MRIIGGTLSGRKLLPPSSITTRPMMDRVRQALFNILLHHDWGKKIGSAIDAAHVLDAFCGTGALSFEALSHGAEHATLFDKDLAALKVARANAEALGVKQSCSILQGDALHPPRATQTCNLIFLAPPYRKDLIPPSLVALDRAGWIAKHPLILGETAKKEILELPQGFAILFSRFYGDTALHFVGRTDKTS
jgi:16S rRNA (guanine966-N2)-methyltransferase